MDDMAHVTDAMLRRVKVDLATDEIAVAFAAFDLRNWMENANVRPLVAQFNLLAEAAGAAEHATVGKSLAKAAQALTSQVRAAKARGLAVDNRLAWSWVAFPCWRARYVPKLVWSSSCDQLLAFYLSLKLNTTSVERDLSKLLAHLNAHSGPLSSTSGVIASIMEINVEGPQQESDFFLPAQQEGGPLCPTEFGVLCAKLWAVHFGRRFRYTYKVKEPKVRADEGRKRAAGSFAASVASRRQASTQAAALAGSKLPSFVPSLQLPLKRPVALSGTRWQSGESQAQAALENFNKHSERKRKRDLLVTRAVCVSVTRGMKNVILTC